MPESSDQTIKQMLAGFTAMQANLGLLPMPTAQAMGGAPQMSMPQMPSVPHPGQAAAMAIQQQQQMMQQTMQAAQMTRYQPPPSAPMGAVGAMAGFAAMNPFAAGPVSMPQMGGMPSMGGRGMPSMTPHTPSIFNPFSPTAPPAHFASHSMRSLQMQSASHSGMVGGLAGAVEGGMGIGGSIIGGALGSAFGPLGTMAGGWLGSKIGGGLASMTIGPAMQDMARGRQIQAMTAPHMVSGSFLNTATGQGMNAESARQVATGIRGLGHDHDFGRTGFNTQDAMRIMQSSSSAGLMAGAQSPDQMLQKVKDISKTVKVLMRITGDPDVRDAIASLGQMRDLGFNGLAAQAGAVANRAAFSRMAGVSQSAMNQYGAMGADMASQFGLSGATGMNAGMSGAALANMAVSSGAVNDLQLSRAGGKSGLAAINARGQLAAMQDDRYLLAAMGRDAKGNMTVDMDAYRKAQTMSFRDVSIASAEALRTMGKEGIFEWNTRKQEFKDQVAQKLTPFEMNMNMLRQASAFQKAVPGMTLGSALQSTTGMSASDARALEVQSQSRGWYDATIQQLEVQKREARDQAAAARDVYRTPGLGTRMKRGVRDAIGSASDALSSPFTRLSEHLQRVDEDEEAADRGERISRYSDTEIAHDDAERKLLRRGLRSRGFQEGARNSGRNFLDDPGSVGQSASRHLNRVGSFLGIAAQSDENRLSSIVSRSRGTFLGLHPFGSFGDTKENMEGAQSLMTAGRAANDAETFGAKEAISVSTNVNNAVSASAGARQKGSSGGSILRAASRNLVTRLKDLKAGVVGSASAVTAEDLKIAYIKAAMVDGGMSQKEAHDSYNTNQKSINAMMAKDVYATNDKSIIEPFAKSGDALTEMGGVNLARPQDGIKKDIEGDMRALGLDQRDGSVSMGFMGLGASLKGYRASEETLGKLKSVVAHADDDVLAIASAQNAAMSGDKNAIKTLEDLASSMGNDKFQTKKAEADKLAKSMDGDTMQALRQMSKTAKGGDDLLGMTGRLKDMFGKKMGLAASSEFMQKLDDSQKGLGGSSSAEAAIGDLDWDTIKRIKEKDPRFADMLTRAKKGDKTAMEEAVMYASPSAQQSRSGGGEGGGIDAVEKQIADVKDMRDKLSKEGGGGAAQLQAASAQLFSSAVERFGKYVTDVTGNAEEKALYNASPWQQSEK